jgi:hypothetical protein
MSELRRQLDCPPNPAAFRTSPTSGIDAPHLQAGWLREHSQHCRCDRHRAPLTRRYGRLQRDQSIDAVMIRKSLLQRTRQSQVAYQDTDHFKITRDFLANLERMLP